MAAEAIESIERWTAKRIPTKLRGAWTAETVKGVLGRASSRGTTHHNVRLLA